MSILFMISKIWNLTKCLSSGKQKRTNDK
jgi:hypothetical protein